MKIKPGGGVGNYGRGLEGGGQYPPCASPPPVATPVLAAYDNIQFTVYRFYWNVCLLICNKIQSVVLILFIYSSVCGYTTFFCFFVWCEMVFRRVSWPQIVINVILQILQRLSKHETQYKPTFNMHIETRSFKNAHQNVITISDDN